MIRRATTAKGRGQTGLFTIEGIRLHERALRANVCPTTAVLTHSFLQSPDDRIQSLLAELRAASCILHTIPETVMNSLTNGRSLGDIIGLVALPATVTLTELLQTAVAPTLLVAVNVIDPGNVGALVRTAHAAGCAALLTLGASDPFHPKAVRTSMGSIFKLPALPYATVDGLLSDLKRQHIQTVGTAVQDGVLLPQADFSASGVALFVGNEYWGLPPAVTAALDTAVTIPMAPGIDSYSINAATAIILYEIGRRLFT